jgi:hypothetical protein
MVSQPGRPTALYVDGGPGLRAEFSAVWAVPALVVHKLRNPSIANGGSR